MHGLRRREHLSRRRQAAEPGGTVEGAPPQAFVGRHHLARVEPDPHRQRGPVLPVERLGGECRLQPHRGGECGTR
jgi:hypothetical protein